MNAVTKLKTAGAIEVSPLARLREPFPDHQVSKLPKPTAKREDMDKLPKANCSVCGGYHSTSRIIHLDYVGHAALTDRLLDVDPEWTWEPVAFRDGLPALDANGGLWIKLTVCGVTRLGYGAADGKKGGDAIKELIGDALRNAAMRFGAALDLWHKGDLHIEEAPDPGPSVEEAAVNLLRGASADKGLFREAWEKNKDGWKRILDGDAYARVVAEMKRLAATFPAERAPEPDAPKTQAAPAEDFGLNGDEIPEFG